MLFLECFLFLSFLRFRQTVQLNIYKLLDLFLIASITMSEYSVRLNEVSFLCCLSLRSFLGPFFVCSYLENVFMIISLFLYANSKSWSPLLLLLPITKWSVDILALCFVPTSALVSRDYSKRGPLLFHSFLHILIELFHLFIIMSWC